MLFSQRKGLTPTTKIVQLDGVDQELRNGLWSAIHIYYWKAFYNASSSMDIIRSSNLEPLFQHYWHSYFKQPLDTIPRHLSDAVDYLRKYFFDCEWFQVYDFLEFTAKNGLTDSRRQFETFCNSVMKRENSAYRFVDDNIMQITSPEEIASVEEALDDSSPFGGVNTHLRTALGLLSDRKNPDYRNSIKESISAVESMCQVLAGKKASLGDALSALERDGTLHGALKQSFSALYGYTSDADGIRHAMFEEPNLTFVDAKYMLIACTAFINFVIGKAAELGLKFKACKK